MAVEIVEGTSQTGVSAATASSPAVAPVSGTLENTGGQADAGASGAPSEETFTQVDPKTLSPELQAHYKALQADYTRKTMAVADKQKLLVEAEKKAKAYDQLTSDQRVKDYLASLSRGERADFKEQKAEAEQRLGEKISDTEFAKAFESKDNFLSLLERVVQDRSAKDQKKIENLEQKVGFQEAANVIESVATEMDKATNQPLRPDFYSLDEDQLITGYLSVRPAKNSSEYRDKVTEAYNWAKSVSSKYYEKGKADALKIVQSKAQNSSQPPTITAKGTYQGPDPKNIDVAEAVALARKGTRVPHNY